MATTEPARHHLYQRLNEILGPEPTETLMELLPPVGWADVATKSDLAHLTAHTDQQFAHIDHRFAQIDERFAQVDQRFVQVDQRFDGLEARMMQQFERHTQMFDLKLDATESRIRTEIADLRTELHRSLRLNLLVTVGVLGTLITVVGALT